MARGTGSRDRDEGGESAALTRNRWRTPAYGPGASSFTFMRRMAEDMDRLLDRFGRPGALSHSDLWSGVRDIDQLDWAPQIETFRRGDKLVLRADLPGMKKDDVNVEIDKGMLKISGERREEHEEERDEYYRSERSYGRFYRAISLPEGTTEDQCAAKFKDGVLEVTVPAPKEKPQGGTRIDIH